MEIAMTLKTVARLSKRRNVVCACIALPLALLLLFSSTSDSDGLASTAHPHPRTNDLNSWFDIGHETVQQYQKYLMSDTTDVQTDRLARVDDICHKVDVPGTVKSLYSYNGVTYCHTYKVASTYWMQIYRFLHGDVSYNVSRPSQIGKFETHLVKARNIRLRHFFSLTDHDDIVSSYRFMMARDPYSRLWSVYVDKFILLDNFFWSRYAPEMRRFYLHPNVTFDLPEVPDNKKRHLIQCLDITFQEFLNYVAKKGERKAENLDDHMRPIHYGCNPCFYKPNFIGKVESMTHEKTPILQKLGLDDKDNIDDFKSYVINEITMISDFEFKLRKIFRDTHGNCVTDRSLEEKMIRAFITNGYLPENVWNKFHGLLPLGKTRFKPTVIEIFLNSSRTSSVVKLQKDRLRTEAYKTVPLSILQKIRTIFTYDFALFGYDPSPDYIFGNRDEKRR